MSKHHKNVPLCFFYTQKSAVHNILIDLFLKSSPPKGIKSYYFVDNKHTFSMSKLTNFFFALAFYTWQIQNLHKLTDKSFISSRQLLKFLEQEDIKQTYYKFKKKILYIFVFLNSKAFIIQMLMRKYFHVHLCIIYKTSIPQN